MAPPVLLSRTLDPILGVFTGIFAYYLYETHPRTALPFEERLVTLGRWKWSKIQHSRTIQLNKDEVLDWVPLEPPTSSSK